MNPYEVFPHFAPRLQGAVLEIGSERGDGSTSFLDAECAKADMPFFTVDIDPEVWTNAKSVCRHGRAICQPGEYFLEGPLALAQTFCFAYLDNFDWDYGGLGPSRVAQVRRYNELGYPASNEGSLLAHEKQTQLLLPRLASGAVVVFDDTWWENGDYTGKGGRAVPFLLEHGFTISEKSVFVGPRKSFVVLARAGVE